MKGNNNCLRRLTAGLVCLCLLLGSLAPAALALDGDIHISSAADWRRLAQNCRLDTWSQGRTVVLDCDLDLTEEDCIPTFGGIFDGQCHTIRGWKLEGEGSHRGLFRYIQEGAVVKNLNVSGTVSVSGDWSGFGGITGVNRGTIAQCGFTGTMDAPDRVGGIAGVNEAAGEIINCTASGVISGEHFTGGIAGENYGSIICFVSVTLGGVDGISYTGQAEPVAYGNLLDLGAPAEFSVFTLTFTADDAAVKQVPFAYGQGIREEDIPAVPEKEGFCGTWEEFNRTALTFDDTIEAVYTPWVTTLSSSDSTILAEGNFAPGTVLEVSPEQGESPASKGEVLLHQSVRVDGGTPFTALRVLRPENAKKTELWCRTEQGTWHQLTCTKEGRYLRAELESEAAELCLIGTGDGTGVWIGGAAAAVGILLLAARRKPQKPKDSGEKKLRIPEKV